MLLAGTQAPDAEPPDDSESVCSQVIQPPLARVPDVNELRSVLFDDLPVKLPISPRVLASLSSDVSRHFQPGTGNLSSLITKIVENTPALGGKFFTAYAVHSIVIAVLIKLDELLPSASCIGLYIQRDGADADSLMTLRSATGGSLRPDGQLRHSDQIRLLATCEEKGAGHALKEAKEDLQKMTSVWSHCTMAIWTTWSALQPLVHSFSYV